MIFDYLSPADVLVAMVLAFAACIATLGVMSWVHGRRIASIPIRIHVGGSRGKTTTTRYIAAALRHSGRRVLTKTTGTLPLVIMPDGQEERWQRWGAPSIAETVRYFRLAVRLEVDVVVLESMAIEPEYLWASETYLVRATHVALTNARPDHAEVLGDSKDAMARALSLLVPRRGHLFLTEESNLDVIAAAGARNGTQITIADGRHESPDQANRKLAMSVCAALGVTPAVAHAGFERAGYDPGGFFTRDMWIAGRELRFHNAFACNDVESLTRLWEDNPAPGTPLILLNTRADRPERTQTFLHFVAGLNRPVHLVMVGAWRMAWVRKAGLNPEQIFRLKAREPEAVLAELSAIASGPEIWGIGNYAGLGQQLTDHLRAEDLSQC